MLMTKSEILLQNQRDNLAFQRFSQVMRDLLINEMEAARLQHREPRSIVDVENVISVKAA